MDQGSGQIQVLKVESTGLVDGPHGWWRAENFKISTLGNYIDDGVVC